jgi:Skp family chaperone for outer membrane proteins
VAETLDKQIQVDKEPAASQGASSRLPAIVVSLSVLAVISAATAYAVPNFNRFAEQSPHETASALIPDPTVSATLKDIQSFQQQNAAALQENGAVLQQNGAMLQQGAANLESLRQGFSAQQTDLKRISNQLSLLLARVDSLQNAVTPLTTSSIPQPNARIRVARAARKRTSRLPKPAGPVSIRGAPLSPAPAPGWGAG